MFINRTFKYRLIPNKYQEKKLNELLGSFRFVYNLLLDSNIEKQKKLKKTLSVQEMKDNVFKIKQEHAFLDSFNLDFFNSVIITLNSDIKQSMRNDSSLPHFKNKDLDTSFVVLNDFLIFNNKINLINIDNIKFKNTRGLQGDVRKIEVSKKNNKWFLSALLKINTKPQINDAKRFIGIDVGLKDFAYFSNGKKISNPRFYRKLEQKLVFEQKKLNRKEKGSSNWKKQKNKVKKIHNDIYNSRINFLHKLSTLVVNHYDVIAIEKLSIKKMSQNKVFSKSIHDASWGTFIEMLKYKSQEKGKRVIEVGRFYPSTQICSNCGSKQFMPVHLRTYCCKNCNHEIDRDYNASKNIENRAKELMK